MNDRQNVDIEWREIGVDCAQRMAVSHHTQKSAILSVLDHVGHTW